MDFSTSSFFRNITFRKPIPLHYQKRFQANISNSIFNQTFNSVVYKKKIKLLTQQNLVLAKALANKEERISIKEDIIAKNEIFVDRILESRQELQVLKTVLETAVAAADRVLSWLNMKGHVSPEGFTKNMKYERMKFKKKFVKRSLTSIQEIEALEEIAESKGDKESVYVPPASTKSSSEPPLSTVKTREHYGLSNKQSLVRKPSIQNLKADANRCSQSTKDVEIPKYNLRSNLNSNIVDDDLPSISSGNYNIDDNSSSNLSHASPVKRSQTKHTSLKSKRKSSKSTNPAKDTEDMIQFPEKPGKCSQIPKEDLTVERITDIYQFPFADNSPTIVNSSEVNKVHQRISKNRKYFSADNRQNLPEERGKRNFKSLTSKKPLPVIPRNVRERSHSPGEVGHISYPDSVATGSLNSVGEPWPVTTHSLSLDAPGPSYEKLFNSDQPNPASNLENVLTADISADACCTSSPDNTNTSQRTSRRRKTISYKEPSLHIKMRRS